MKTPIEQWLGEMFRGKVHPLITRLTPDHFGIGLNREIFITARKLAQEKRSFSQTDFINLMEEHTSYILGLTTRDVEVNHSSVVDLENIIIKNFTLQKANRVDTQLHQDLKESRTLEDIESAMAKAESSFQEIRKSADSAEVKTFRECSLDHLKKIDERWNQNGQIPGINTGNPKLDSLTLGYQKGQLIIYGARPSQGKSTQGLNSAVSIALRGIPVGFISLESGIPEIMDRALAQVSGVDLLNIQTGNFKSSTERNKILKASERLDKSPLLLNDRTNQTIYQVAATARRMVRVFGAEALFIDYLGLIHWPGARDQYTQVSNVSTALKELARELNVPLIVLSQLNRGAAESKRPHLSDLRNSGQVEQDGDIVILIYQIPDQENEDNPLFGFDVVKNRHGRCGLVKVRFKKNIVRFEPV